MITNPEILSNVYRLKNKSVIRYLIYDRHLPVLSVEKEWYYFSDNDNLRKSLEEMPLLMKAGFLLCK
jgi:hypothetical protein